MSPDSSVEAYLDRLFDQLAGTGGRGRRILAEVEDHLHQAVEHAAAEGTDPAAAEVEALARFGDPRVLVDATRPQPVARPRLVVMGWLLGGVAALVYGVSGLLTWLARWPYAHLYAALRNLGDGPIYFPAEPSDDELRTLCTGPTHRPCLVMAGDGSPGSLYLGDRTSPLRLALLVLLLGLAASVPLWFVLRRSPLNPPRLLAPLVGLGGASLVGLGVLGSVQGGPGDPLQNLVTGTVLVVTAAVIRRLRHRPARRRAAWPRSAATPGPAARRPS